MISAEMPACTASSSPQPPERKPPGLAPWLYKSFAKL
ncbi:hypothetical protein X751_25205 [Mesorhizobium sp. LNJC395A00]|nr:hypothetical protein X754_22375 [Mesorhizobium sp. LNJC403B00]ESY14894.1 hypothetical protein X751_25205 [Mesorhizobium sp. LNJC395A00]